MTIDKTNSAELMTYKSPLSCIQLNKMICQNQVSYFLDEAIAMIKNIKNTTPTPNNKDTKLIYFPPSTPDLFLRKNAPFV